MRTRDGRLIRTLSAAGIRLGALFFELFCQLPYMLGPVQQVEEQLQVSTAVPFLHHQTVMHSRVDASIPCPTAVLTNVLNHANR